MRINKFLADQGVDSRRAIDALILEKRIKVNGITLEKPGYSVLEKDQITLDGKVIGKKVKQEYVYILLNKPTDCITTVKDTHGRKTVLDYVSIQQRIFPIGRLDKNTTGVLILTNDGECANTLMHPRFLVEKVYHAYLDKVFTDRDRKIFETGIMLDKKMTSPCTTRFIRNNKRDVVISLHEGKNRQIHRMFGSRGYIVQKLDRMSYARLTASGLKQGEWRYLTQKEILFLKNSDGVVC